MCGQKRSILVKNADSDVLSRNIVTTETSQANSVGGPASFQLSLSAKNTRGLSSIQLLVSRLMADWRKFMVLTRPRISPISFVFASSKKVGF